MSTVSSNKLIDDYYNKTGCNPGFAALKFNKLVAQGLVKNGVRVISLSCPPFGHEYNRRRWVSYTSEEEEGVCYKYVPFIRVGIIKHVCVMIYSFIYVLIWGLNKRVERVIICDVLNNSLCLGALLAAKLNCTKTVGIVTDVPGTSVGTEGRKIGVATKVNRRLLSKYSFYVLLTEAMNDIVNVRRKPFIVLEGLVDSSIISNQTQETTGRNREVIYAGGLNKVFGLELLVNGFLKAGVEGVKLIIYGSGEYEKELISITKHNPNLEFRGIRNNLEVFNHEKNALLLVNPRPPLGGEYTKYSFPSKNMEYMASGTPVLTTKLPGMPNEYLNYVYLVEDISENGFANAFRELLNKSQEELSAFGKAAKQFVLEKKNNIVQTRRIIELIHGN